MKRSFLLTGPFFTLVLTASLLTGGQEEKLYREPINLHPRPIAKDPTVKYDYDIVYVRTPRQGDKVLSLWSEVFNPATMDAGGDLVLLRPDGSEEVLVKGGKGSVTDPCVSLDGEWVYYCLIHDLTNPDRYKAPAGADLYKIHVKSHKVVRLTHGEVTPNTGVASWSKDFRTREDGKNYVGPSLNMGPCPLPGGKLMFTSSRNVFLPPQHSWPVQQLFIMDEDGGNVECVGHLNLGMALHPVALKDGRVMFSSLESQGLRDRLLWGLWSIHPDGTNWGPLVSAYSLDSVPNSFHFQAQLSDGRIVWESYYNLNNNGFGAYYTMPVEVPETSTAFGPAYAGDPRNPLLRRGRFPNGLGRYDQLAFSPYGLKALTPFTLGGEGPADEAVLGQKDSPRVGKFTHPAGAPDNHLLTVWTPGPGSHYVPVTPEHMYDGGLYLIKGGKPIDEPGQMLLIKNDPKYNEQWPHALVPYKRIYGIDEPKRLPTLANNGQLSPHLPEGTPFGLVGTSSFYKRESYPNGAVARGTVTAAWAGNEDPLGYQWLGAFNTLRDWSRNWHIQGADAGRYSNSDIHAVRILAMEAATDRSWGHYPHDNRLFRNHANERLRILGEIPLRKFHKDGKQPLDPDGHPDTSFLAKLPGDTVFTFQTVDKDGMVLNMAQTWHQLRPGEIRHDCGGCHAHSQKPTLFKDTAAAKLPDYQLFDLSKHTPLLTAKGRDESGRKWDTADETGLRYETDVKNVEFYRDIKPILDRSCAACHNRKWPNPAGNLVLNDDDLIDPFVSGTYFRLAKDQAPKFGYKPVNGQWVRANASRYIRMFQSRRSLLTWKIYGRRTDGWSNDDFPTERVPGKADTLQLKGQPVPDTPENRDRADLDFTGSVMPPPEAVAGTYVGPGGQKIKVQPLTDEDRRTLVRWIDLGCPIDLDFDPKRPQERGRGWLVDEARPTLTMTHPQANANAELTRILIGVDDYNTGIHLKTFSVVADFAIDSLPPGTNLASRFTEKSRGVHELKLKTPITKLARGKLTVSVQDGQGNVSRIERTLSVGASATSKP